MGRAERFRGQHKVCSQGTKGGKERTDSQGTEEEVVLVKTEEVGVGLVSEEEERDSQGRVGQYIDLTMYRYIF